MCLNGKIGAKIKIPQKNIALHEYFFGEDQSRYLIEVNKKNKEEVTKILEKNGIFYEIIGKTQEGSLELDKEFKINLNDLYELSTFWFKNYFKDN